MTFSRIFTRDVLCVVVPLALSNWLYGLWTGHGSTVTGWDFWAQTLQASLVYALGTLYVLRGVTTKPWIASFQEAVLGIGLQFISIALVTYFPVLPEEYLAPVWIIIPGAAIAAFFRLLLVPEGSRAGKLVFAGVSALTPVLAASFGDRVEGAMCSSPGRVPPGVSLLQPPSQGSEYAASARIVVGVEEGISPTQVLALQDNGFAVEQDTTVYEERFLRVSVESMKPSSLISHSSLMANRQLLALQSLYTNLAGVALMISLLPLLLILSILVAALGGRGPIFESVPCIGFQRIPFLLFRFRVRSSGQKGNLTPIGKLISWLGLQNLPQTLNVVRGELAFVGPRPVRAEFADRLDTEIVFHAHRFSVKPGLFGWAAHNIRSSQPPEIFEELGYDFYYIKHMSLAVDLDVLLSALLGR